MTHEKYGDYRDVLEAEAHKKFADFGFCLVHEEDRTPLEYGHMMVIFGWTLKSCKSNLLRDLCQVCEEQGILCLDKKTGRRIRLDITKAMFIVGAVEAAYHRGIHLKKLGKIRTKPS